MVHTKLLSHSLQHVQSGMACNGFLSRSWNFVAASLFQLNWCLHNTQMCALIWKHTLIWKRTYWWKWCVCIINMFHHITILRLQDQSRRRGPLHRSLLHNIAQSRPCSHRGNLTLDKYSIYWRKPKDIAYSATNTTQYAQALYTASACFGAQTIVSVQDRKPECQHAWGRSPLQRQPCLPHCIGWNALPKRHPLLVRVS